ncbi:MAG: hypothetical protein WC554_17615 [Clostridia bacterium]
MNIWEITRLAEEKDLKERKDRVIKILNDLFKLCQPITYGDFNKKIEAIDSNKLYEYEQSNPEAGLLNMSSGEDPNSLKFGISTLSIIATITDILVGDRIAFCISDGKDEKESSKDITKDTILGVDWYYQNIDRPKEKKNEVKKEDVTKDAG